jgi:hypothetical protein
MAGWLACRVRWVGRVSRGDESPGWDAKVGSSQLALAEPDSHLHLRQVQVSGFGISAGCFREAPLWGNPGEAQILKELGY